MKAIIVCGNSKETMTWVHFFKSKVQAKAYINMKAISDSIDQTYDVTSDNDFHYSVSYVSRSYYKKGVKFKKQIVKYMTVHFSVFPTLGEINKEENEEDCGTCNPVGIPLK